MDIFYPDYYPQFRCIAGACPDSCCHAWAVAVDEASAHYYRSLPGALGDALRTYLTEEDGDTVLSLTADGRCPMWRQDGLCEIQCQLGEDALCQTCRDFPRLRHDYGSFAELGLELSCPEAARLILCCDRHSLLRQTVPGDEAPGYDPEVMDILLQSREALLGFLDEKRFSVGQALAVMLLYGYAVQNWIDGGDAAILSPEKTLETACSLPCSGGSEELLHFFNELEILTGEWKQRLASPMGSDWQEAHRAIARYGIQRYWLQAVSDYDLIGRVKMVIVSCLVIKLLGGDVLQTAQLYSKEIENDADNVDAILDGAYTSPALADMRLLNLLLN